MNWADVVKIGFKIAAVIAIAAAIWGIFSSITLPAFDFSLASTYVRKVYNIAYHFVPGWTILWNLGIMVLSVELGIYAFKATIIVYKIIMKLFE